MSETYGCPLCAAENPKLLIHRVVNGTKYHLARCSRCKLHFCAPAPTPAELDRLYSGNYHGDRRDNAAAERASASVFSDYREFVLRFLKSGRSLDIGTSTGQFPSMLKQAGFNAEGVEYNEASAQWGEAHYGIKIWVGDLETSGAKPGAYDLISMTEVLEHMLDPVRYLAGLRRYLKPGGFVLVTFPDVGSLEARLARLLAKVSNRDYVAFRCCQIPYHIWEFTPAIARATFEKAGFQVVGFRRSNDPDTQKPFTSFSPFLLPIWIVDHTPLRRHFGTQMQFMLTV